MVARDRGYSCQLITVKIAINQKIETIITIVLLIKLAMA